MSYSVLPSHVSLARLLSEVEKIYPDAETLMGAEAPGLSPLDRHLARQRRMVADVVGIMERLELVISLASDRNGVRTAAPGILRHVPPGHLSRGIFSALHWQLENWRDMDGASIMVEADRTGAILDAVRASLAPADERRSRGRPAKYRRAGEAYRARFPGGHGKLPWKQVQQAVEEEMGETVSVSTIKKGIENP